MWNFHGSWFLTLEFPPKGCHTILQNSHGWKLVFEGWSDKSKNSRGFFSEKYMYPQPPCLMFFWNSPILMKGGRECLACNVPRQTTKIRLTKLDSAQMSFTLSSVREVCKLDDVAYFGELYKLGENLLLNLKKAS